MVLVGYYLARCGRRAESGAILPPVQLRTNHWNRAYAAFFASLGDGRTLRTFANSLKNARDSFDSHVASGRVGWRQTGPEREPLPLTTEAQRAFNYWKDIGDDDLWEAVSVYVDADAIRISSAVLNDALAELGANEEVQARTEGGRRVVISTRVERNPRLRNDAIRIHGLSCAVCGFNFGEIYGEWGEGFIEVHHLWPIGDDQTASRVTDPASDLAVLCANCHRMVHRKRGLVLTIDTLRQRIDAQAMEAWAARTIERLKQPPT